MRRRWPRSPAAGGFYDLGRFAAEYRTTYGERPRETLHRQGRDDTEAADETDEPASPTAP